MFTEQDMLDYQTLTYLSSEQILTVHKKFQSLDPRSTEGEKNPILPIETVLQCPELRVNPFKDRIVKVFCSNPSYMSFEEFLDMMSVFSDKTPMNVKAQFAFKIYDFDDDDMISREDVAELINRLKGDNEMNDEDMEQILENVMSEADIDADGFVTYPEFEHMIAKCPEFMHSFRIRM
ncbi:calcium and integrin-binding protein 1-like [Uloborus diversus]|uniref:calcium and integrin-binding protein 1-like n=1 Tax=Uloborus diversus TaxID=327109 RepID=UPI0024099EB0|nr:calcium and integrin-binding protein 1-like [Uloborus diversus]